MALRLPWPRLTPEVRRTLAIMGPACIGAGVTQVNLLISTALASLLPGGSVSYLYYADRLNQLPLGVVGIAVGTAILPPLSRQVRLGDHAGAVATQNRGLELALLLTLPAAVALAVLAQPILAVLFQRGAFGPADTAATAAALAAYAAGLPAFVLVKVLAPAFFARHDTKTPVKVAIAAMAVNLVLTLVPDAVSGPCRDRAGDHLRRLAQCADPARRCWCGAGISGSTARARAQSAADRGGGARHGGGAAAAANGRSRPAFAGPAAAADRRRSPGSSAPGSPPSPCWRWRSASPIGASCCGRLRRQPA